MNIERVFPTEIWSMKVDNYKSMNESLYKSSINLFNEDKEGLKVSNYGGWHSNFLHNYESDKTKDFNKLRDIIYKMLNDNKFGSDLKIIDMWININRNRDSNASHCHTNCNFSGCYYVKVPEKSGNLSFLEPYKWHNKNNSKIVKDEKNIPEHIVISEEGMLYIFRGFLPHKVGKNLSESKRISIAFNIKGNE